MRHLTLVFLFSLLLTADATAQALGRPAAGAELREIKSGAQWRVFSSKAAPRGSAQTFAVFPASAVDELEAEGILPAAEAGEIREDLAAEGLDYRQVGDIFVVHLEAAAAAAQGAVPTKGWQSPKTVSKSWSRSHTEDYNLIHMQGEFCTGDLDVILPMSADVDATVTYQIKTNFLGIPYKFRLIESNVAGDLAFNGSVQVGAGLQVTVGCEWKHKLADVYLGSFTIWIGPVPVYLEFRFVLDIGFIATVKAAGTAQVRADFHGAGTFDVTCTSSGCAGDSSFDDSFDVGEPTYEFTLDAEARIWARPAINMMIYWEDVGMISLGVTGFVQADLFGYAGNNCGDLDGNGSGDMLEDLLVDLDAGYVVDVRTRGLILPDHDWILREDLWHLYFWDLHDDGEGWNLADPLVSGPQQLEAGELATYEFTTRPCYPYSDDLNLQWTGPVTGNGRLTPRTGVLTDSEMPSAGEYTLTVTAVDDDHGRSLGVSTSLPVTVTGAADEKILTNGVAEDGLSGDAGSQTFFRLEVPAGAADLTFELSGGSGNADLYVLFDGRPSTSVFDCESSGSSNSESCSFPVPEAGWYLVMVYGSDAYSGASLVGSYIDPSSTELINDVPEDGLASAAGSHSFYTLEVPAEATDLSFVLSGGTGDADLYVRFHTWPSTTRYNCRSWESGNDESCSFPAPLIGTWYVLVYGYETYSGASLKASYTVPVGGGELSNGIPKTDLLGDAGSRLFYTLEVPPGATDLSFVLSGGTGDADLYGLFGTRPSLLSYKCHSWNNGNDESCWFPKPQAGTYHVMVYGYTSYSGVSLMASYVEAVALYNGVPVNDLAGDDESETLYFVEVPEEASDLTITLSGGSGDADLYGRFGVPPDLSLLIYDCHSWNLGNNDSCSYPEPQVGRYYVLVHGYDEYSGANLEASFTEPAVAGELINGAPVNELEGANESETFYTFDVPPGATDLTLNLVGGSGDADLYVRFGLHPSTSDYDCRSRDDGNGDSCSFPEPQAGTWYVLVYGYSSYSGASLTASYTASGGELSNGVPETDLSGATDSQIFYTLEVPAGVVGLTFETSGGTGDADLYVMFGAPPSTTAYDCESGNIDNIESCSFPESQAGTYHVLVYADKNYSGASLVASYTETAIFSDGFESGDTTAWSDRQP